jgi:uncharacterized damage-inducible protein DinB
MSTVEMHDRPEVPRIGDERPMLDAWLEFHRATLLWKCSGLSDEQLKRRSAPPSSLSLLGLVRHMTEVERSWFRKRIGGEDLPPLYYSEEQPDDDFDALDSTEVASVFAAYRQEMGLCRAVAAAHSLDEVVRNGTTSVRWIYLHMIEEYARHNGHADLLREAIDGSKGD